MKLDTQDVQLDVRERYKLVHWKKNNNTEYEELLNDNPNLKDFIATNDFKKRKVHTEPQFTRGTKGENIAKEAQKHNLAVVVMTSRSPCVKAFKCTKELHSYASRHKVPIVVIYRYTMGDCEDSVKELSAKRIPVFRVIGKRLFFRNRRKFINGDNDVFVSHASFIKHLQHQAKLLVECV